ncbi:MAG TPA: amidohydrolase family protein [Firmicutes bacterium]|nr:amidohydrolase family protein [Bacillota bacterium]
MRTLIRARGIVDGTGTGWREGLSLLIDEERIVRLGLASELRVEAQRELDFSNCTLVPGFVDAHTHITIRPGEGNQHGQLAAPPVWQAIRAVKNIRQMLQSGVTTIRVMTEKHRIDVEFKDAIERREMVGPRMRVSTVGLTATNGHAPSLPSVDGPDDLRKAVRRNLRAGADLIKIFCTGGVSSTFGMPITASSYSREEIRAVVEEAHRAGKPVASHAHGGEGVTLCVEEGVDSIEHGALLTEENIEKMAARNTWLVLTNAILFHPSGIERGDAHQPAIMSKVLQAREAMESTFERVKEAGIRFAVGTDSMHGLIGYEMEWLVKHGITPEQAIVAATRNGAQVLGLADQVGTLEPGKRADFVVLNGNPLKDIKAVYRVAAVFKDGQMVVPDQPDQQVYQRVKEEI